MFGVGYQEMLLIGLAALLLFGPGKLPEVMGQAGKWYKQFRDVTSGLTDEFNKTVAEAKGELEGVVGDLGPMQKQVNSITKSVQKDLGANGKARTGTTGAKKSTTTSSSSKSKSTSASKSTATKSTTASKTTSSRTSTGGTGSRTNQPKPSMTSGKPVVNASKEDPFASISLFEQPERPTKRRARSATPSALTDLTPRDIAGDEPDTLADTSSASAPAPVVIDADDPIARARQRRRRAGYAQATA
jgi:TatA/E family protein of Tat protein translocase